VKTAVEAIQLVRFIFEKPTEVETLVERIRSARAARLAKDDQATREQIDAIMRNRGW
jgi:hypothetical protein